jgi:glycosyltransferase involved in cell wall biosynthesis
VLLLKTVYPNTPEFQEVMHLGAIQVYGWLSEYEKMALYDLADITLMFSRGGGFEVNALESLARGVPVVTSNVGSWTDYVPSYLQVKVGERVRVFEDNAIHVGYGYKVDVESAVDRIHDILDNYDEYRGRVGEWRHKVLFSEYRWDRVALMLADVARLKPQATTG